MIISLENQVLVFFLSGCLRQVLLYTEDDVSNTEKYSLPTGKFSMLFCRLLIFLKSSFPKYSFRNIIRVSNSLDPDQDRHDLGPNCLQKLSADDTMSQRVKRIITTDYSKTCVKRPL